MIHVVYLLSLARKLFTNHSIPDHMLNMVTTLDSTSNYPNFTHAYVPIVIDALTMEHDSNPTMYN